MHDQFTRQIRSAIRRARGQGGAAFSLTELLVVIAIIGAVAAISIPALKGIGQAQTISNGARQLMDDLMLARQYAMLNRSVVHMVFVPPTVSTLNLGDDVLANRLEGGAYTTYAIYGERTIGDQPGRARARYLSKWKTLPDGVFIAEHEFPDMTDLMWEQVNNTTNRPFHYDGRFYFPALTNAPMRLPHISFNPDGSLLSISAKRDEFIHLARGSVLVARNANGDILDFSVKETPLNNSLDNYYRIRVDGLTGRASLERPEIQ